MDSTPTVAPVGRRLLAGPFPLPPGPVRLPLLAPSRTRARGRSLGPVDLAQPLAGNPLPTLVVRAQHRHGRGAPGFEVRVHSPEASPRRPVRLSHPFATPHLYSLPAIDPVQELECCRCARAPLYSSRSLGCLAVPRHGRGRCRRRPSRRRHRVSRSVCLVDVEVVQP